MSVGSLFIVIQMFFFLAFMVYRWYIKKDYILAIIAGIQMILFVFGSICLVTGTQISNLNEIVFIVLGVLLPGYYFVSDCNNMLKKVRAHGIDIKLVESDECIEEKGRGSDYESTIMDIEADILPANLIKHINIDSDDILRNIKRNIIRARGFTNRCDFVRARQIYESIAMVVGNSIWLLFNLGNLYYRSGKYSDAAKSYRKALRIWELSDKKQSENADEVMEKDVTDLSKQPIADKNDTAIDKYIIYYNLGNAYFRQKDYHAALDAYTEALHINPSFENAKENMARTFMWLGRFSEAEEYFKKVIANDPYSFKGHYTLGTIYSDLKRYDEAIDELNTAVKLNPNSRTVYHALGRIYIKVARYSDAVSVYNTYLMKYPGDYRAYYNIGMALYNQNKNIEAIEAFERALEIKPDYYEAKYNIGVVLDEMGKVEDAIRVFKDVIEAKPDFVDAYNNLGIILSTNERYLEALNVYMNGLKKNPESYSLYYNMGLTLFDMKRYDDAVEAFKNALDIKQDEYEVHYYMGLALFQMEKYSDAVIAFKKAVRYKPDYSEGYYNLSVVYSVMRKYDYAIENLEKAISLNEEFKSKAAQSSDFKNLKGKFEFERLIS